LPTVNCKSMYSKWRQDELWRFFQMTPFCKIGHNTCGAFSSRHHFHLVNRKTSEDEICRGWCTLSEMEDHKGPWQSFGLQSPSILLV
jgi:hypothetical protein